jgi:radical SAM protein with 4Fe4S-binding SPASM domain
MMRNAELLLKKGIAVALRMNYDQDTYKEFADLLQEAKARFPKDARLMVYPHQINRDYPEEEREATEAWLNKKNVELNDLSCEAGLNYRDKLDLPCLSYEMCGAADGRWYVITPQGHLICCSEQLEEDQIKGDIWQGATNEAVEKSWKQFADYEKCMGCVMFPRCARTSRCNAKDRCSGKIKLMNQYELKIRKCFQVSNL